MIATSDRGEITMSTGKSLAALTAIVALTLGTAALAQQKAPEKAAPAAKAEKKAKSACNAISEETACKADAACAWVAALMDKSTGKQKRKAYCRTKPKPPAKKAKEPAKK
jgi:hypothetical protein